MIAAITKHGKIVCTDMITLDDGRDVSIKARIIPPQPEYLGLPFEPARFEVLVAKWVLSDMRLTLEEEEKYLPLEELLRRAVESTATGG